MIRPVIREITIRRKVFHCRLCGGDFDSDDDFNQHVPQCMASHPESEPDIVGNVYIRYDGPTFELFKVAEVRKGAAYGYLTSFTSHDGGDPAKGTRMMRQSYRSVDIAQLGDVYQLTDPRSPVHLIEARMDAFTRILEGIYSPDDGRGAVE